MGEPSIVEKLRKLLEGQIDNEVKALYFLVEARKLIEHHKGDTGFPLLQLMRFYCDWVVHIKLSQWGNKVEVLCLLHRIEAELRCIGEDEASLELADIIGFTHLIAELGTFLEYFKLPTTLVENSFSWHHFAISLGGVLHDQPLVIEKDDLAITELRITRVDSGSIFGRVRLKDGSEPKSDVAILTPA